MSELTKGTGTSMSDEFASTSSVLSHKAIEVDKYFVAAYKNSASDLHLKVGEPPLFRIRGTIVRAKMPPFTEEQINELLHPLLGQKEAKELEERGGADFAVNIPDVGRFRLNVYRQRGVLSMSARCVKTNIPSIEELN